MCSSSTRDSICHSLHETSDLPELHLKWRLYFLHNRTAPGPLHWPIPQPPRLSRSINSSPHTNPVAPLSLGKIITIIIVTRANTYRPLTLCQALCKITLHTAHFLLATPEHTCTYTHTFARPHMHSYSQHRAHFVHSGHTNNSFPVVSHAYWPLGLQHMFLEHHPSPGPISGTRDTSSGACLY